MKKTLSFAAAIFAAALVSVSCNNAQTAPAAVNVEPAAAGSIVYIQIDSLVNGYDMFNDEKSALESEVQAIQDDLQKKGNAFQKSVSDFENKVNKGLLTRSQAEQQQMSLQQRQQELQNLSQEKGIEMQEKEAVMLNKVMDNIHTFLEEYNKTHNYALILTTSAASNNVIIGNPSLDITQDVLNGLNAEYVKSRK